VSAPRGTRVTLLDSNLHAIDTSLHGLNAEVDAGFYKVVANRGDGTFAQIVEVSPDASSPSHVNVPVGPVSSAAPGPWSRQTHEYQSDSARDLSRQPQVVLGNGSELFLFIRSFQEDASSRGFTADDLARGLDLLDLAGNRILDISDVLQRVTNVPDPCGGVTVAVDPGAYRLRMTTQAAGVVEMCLVASPGWQLQYFALLRDWDRSDSEEWAADLVDATLSMGRPGIGVDPWSDEQLSLVEIARTALLSNRPALASSDLDELLEQKFSNPMLGILGAHALLAQPSVRDPEQVSAIVGKLRSLLGPHPDVDALECAVGRTLAGESLHGAPPMLTRSWTILTRASATNRALIPDGSLASKIGHRLWGPSTWLLWEHEEHEAEEEAGGEEPDEAALLQTVLGRIRTLNDESMRQASASPRTTDLESLVAETLYAKESRATLTKAKPETIRVRSVEELAKSVNVPPSTIRIALKGLSKKL
jgi:hypothetical protein